jgi:hypothetical protein
MIKILFYSIVKVHVIFKQIFVLTEYYKVRFHDVEYMAFARVFGQSMLYPRFIHDCVLLACGFSDCFFKGLL